MCGASIVWKSVEKNLVTAISLFNAEMNWITPDENHLQHNTVHMFELSVDYHGKV